MKNAIEVIDRKVDELLEEVNEKRTQQNKVLQTARSLEIPVESFVMARFDAVYRQVGDLQREIYLLNEKVRLLVHLKKEIEE